MYTTTPGVPGWDYDNMKFQNNEVIPTTATPAARWLVEWKGSRSANWAALPPIGASVKQGRVLARSRASDTSAHIYLPPTDPNVRFSEGPMWNLSTMRSVGCDLDPKDNPAKKWVISWQTHPFGRPTEGRDVRDPDWDKAPKVGQMLGNIGEITDVKRDLIYGKCVVYVKCSPGEFVDNIRRNPAEWLNRGLYSNEKFMKLLKDHAPDLYKMFQDRGEADGWLKQTGFDKCKNLGFFGQIACVAKTSLGYLFTPSWRLAKDATGADVDPTQLVGGVPEWVVPVLIGLGIVIVVPPVISAVRPR